jgi:hypothetical protein
MEETNDGIKISAVTDCFLWGTSWKRRNSWPSEDNYRARCTEIVEKQKNYRDSNEANASQVWRLRTFLNLFFISEFCFSMISLLIPRLNFVDISSFKRVMHDMLLEFISFHLFTSTAWHRPQVLRSLDVWSCACCDDARCVILCVLWWCSVFDPVRALMMLVCTAQCYDKQLLHEKH